MNTPNLSNTNIRTALAQLGVGPDTLTQEEKDTLDRNGFLYLHGILSSSDVAQFCARLDELLAEEGDKAGSEVHTEPGTQRLSDLVNKDSIFDVCFTHPRVLAAIACVLDSELKLSSLNSRFSLPGSGLQALHADWGEAVAPGNYAVCNSIWLLDDFTEENGPTRVVPGSHRSGLMPKDVMPEPTAPHPEEQKIIAPVGTVVVFNSHVWHGGTLNHSAQRRRAMHSYFCRRDQPQQLDQRRYLRKETASRLSDAALCVLDVL
jgi:ectoine hydroxylase-related dioxygenase (phytanoyl-CoA dioxygenase family)